MLGNTDGLQQRGAAVQSPGGYGNQYAQQQQQQQQQPAYGGGGMDFGQQAMGGGGGGPPREVHSPSNIASMKTFFGSLLAVNAFTLLFTLATVRHGLQYIIPALLCTAGG